MSSSSKHPFREPLKHERPPEAGIYVGGKPVYVLPRGTEREKGRPSIIQHIELVEGVSQLVRSCYGPRSTYKLIKAESGASFLTNDAFTIFSHVDLNHPLARVVAGAGIDAAKESGGGSASTILLTARILRSLLPLVRLGVSQSTLVNGCISALGRIRKQGEKFAFVADDALSLVRPVVRTALVGTVLSEQADVFEKIVIEAVQFTEALERREFWRLDDIYVRTQVGGSLSDSRLVRGLALLRESIHPHTIEHRDDARLLLVKGEFNIPRKGNTPIYDHTLQVNSPEDYAKMLRSKQDVLLDIMAKVRDCVADVILVEKGIDDMAIDYFVRRGVIVIRRFPPQEFDHVIAVTGAQPISDFNDVSSQNLVKVGKVSFLRVAGNTWWFLEGFPDSRSCEVFVRGADELVLQETGRILKSVFKMLQKFLNEPKYVYGAGWYEMAVASDLRTFSRTMHGRDQLVVEKVAEAIEYLPWLLAESAGLDPISTLAELRRLRSSTRPYGIDCSSMKVEDVGELGIVEPLHIKLQSMNSAFEAAVTVLRVDEVLISRKLTKSEQYYLERLEKTTPEATRKIQRDYGI